MNQRITCKAPAGVCVLLVGMCFRLQAMDRWAALSQIESGDNDHAVGRQGEVSRFQILPQVWRRYASREANWHVPADALAVARVTMKDRCLAFERQFHRSPTDVEFYILWNAPAQVARPSRIVLRRARRFQNLLSPDAPVRVAAFDPPRAWQPTTAGNAFFAEASAVTPSLTQAGPHPQFFGEP